jgi:hypothetical protein
MDSFRGSLGFSYDTILSNVICPHFFCETMYITKTGFVSLFIFLGLDLLDMLFLTCLRRRPICHGLRFL